MKQSGFVKLLCLSTIMMTLVSCSKTPETKLEAAQKVPPQPQPQPLVETTPEPDDEAVKQAQKNKASSANMLDQLQWDGQASQVATTQRPTPTPTPAGPDANALIEQAQQKLEEKNFEEASALLDEIDKQGLSLQQMEAIQELRRRIQREASQSALKAVGSPQQEE